MLRSLGFTVVRRRAATMILEEARKRALRGETKAGAYFPQFGRLGKHPAGFAKTYLAEQGLE